MYTVAIVVPNHKALETLAKKLGVDEDFNSLCENEDVKQAVLQEVKKQGASGMLAWLELGLLRINILRT